MSHPRLPDEPKNCDRCGLPLVRHERNGVLVEDRAAFRRRRFCGAGCARAAQPPNRREHGPCTAEGCDRTGKAKGLCGKHYQRRWKETLR